MSQYLKKYILFISLSYFYDQNCHYSKKNTTVFFIKFICGELSRSWNFRGAVARSEGCPWGQLRRPRNLRMLLSSPAWAATEAPGIDIFIYSYRIRSEFFQLRCSRLVVCFARDAILTSSALVLVKYWLVFRNKVRIFPAILLWFSGSCIWGMAA